MVQDHKDCFISDHLMDTSMIKFTEKPKYAEWISR